MARNEQAKATIYLDGKQAEAALEGLKNRAKALKDELKKAQEAGDMSKTKKLQSEIAGVEAATRSLRKESFDYEKVLKNMNGSSLKELRQALRTVQIQYEKMKQTDPGYKETKEQVDTLKTKVKELTGVTRSQTGFLGNLQDKLALMPGAFGSMASGIIAVGRAAMAFFLTPVGAIIGIVAAIGMGIKSLITNSVEFGKAASSLSAITGAVGKDLDFLKKQAREISKDSTQSATEMLKAFQTIGGAMPALLKNGPLLAEVTKNAVALSESSGGQLSITEAAKAAAAALNQFNIPLTESARAVNVLAAGSLEGAAEVDNITESLKNLGPVASSANMSLENTVAGIEILAEKGLLGAEAGTKLRGVILKLQGESLGYASGQFNLKDAMDEANKKIDEQSTAVEKDAYLLKLFGIENVTAGRIMLENVENYVELTEAVTGTNTAFEQAKIQQDNLAGSNNKFREAWKNMMLSIEDGNGILSRAWKGIVDAGTWLINGITSQFENFGASIRAVGIVFVNFYEQMKTPVAALGRLLKAVFTLDFDDMQPALSAFKSSFADIGKDGSLNLSKIAIEQLKLGQASKEATAELKRQKEELEKLGETIETETEQQIKAREEAFKKAQEAFDKAATEEKNKLKQQLLDKKLTQQQYNLEMYSLELAHLIAMKELRARFGQETATADAQILDKKLQGQDISNKELERIDKLYQGVVNDSLKHQADMQSDALKEMGAEWAAYVKEKDDATQKEIDANIEKEQSARKLKEAQIQYAVQSGIAAVENAETMQEAAKGVLNSIRDQIKAYIAEAVTIAALKALKSVPFPLNMIAAAVAGGAAALLFNKLIPKFDSKGKRSGGFTNPYAGEDEITDFVHGKEWVASASVVSNPATRRFIDVFEIAQRNGTIRQLSIPGIIGAVTGAGGKKSGGFTSGAQQPASSNQQQATSNQYADATLAALARELAEFRKWKPKVYTELIKKDLETLDDINKKRGL